LEGLLEIVGLEMTMKSVGAGTLSESWRERVPDFKNLIGLRFCVPLDTK